MSLHNFEQIVGSEFLRESRLFSQRYCHISTSRSLAAIFFDFAVILALAGISIYLNHWLIYLLAVILIAGRQHGLLAILHDGAHGLLSKNSSANQVIADLFCALPFGNCFRAFANGHLAHHKFLNSDRDPEWSKKVQQGWTFPKPKKDFFLFVLLECIVRNTRGRVLKFIAMFTNHSLGYRLGIFLYYIAALTFLFHFGLLKLFALYWLVPALVILPYLSFTRGLAEHFGLDLVNELHSSRDVRAGFANRIFFPHGSSFHLTHHLFPRVPCFYLQKMHKYLMQNEGFRRHSKQNDSYYFTRNSVLQDIFGNPAPKDRWI